MGFDGGGIQNRGTLTLMRSTVSGNTASDDGGGIYSRLPSVLTIINSTVSSNAAPRGGGIWNGASPANLTNSTVAGNSALDAGGGIFGSANINVTQSTFVNNSGPNATGGITGYATLGSSIFASSACPFSATLAIVSAGHNVTSNQNCGLDSTGVLATDAGIGLAILAPNGSSGPPTAAISPASAAHAVVPLTSCAAVDERGVVRPGISGSTFCDAGAYEYTPPIPLTVRASDGAMNFGGPPPKITPSYEGFVGGDTATELTSLPVCVPNVVSTTPVGRYENTSSCDGATSLKYTIGYANGLVTVSRAHPIVTTSATPLATFTSTGHITFTATVVNGDSVTHAPVPGVLVTFTVPVIDKSILAPVVKAPVTCTALTNASGIATCISSNPALKGLAGVSYTAASADGDTYIGAYGTATLTRK